MNHEEADAAIDTYIDCRLDPGDAATFRARLASDEPLRRRVELAEEIDRGIARLHARPSEGTLSSERRAATPEESDIAGVIRPVAAHSSWRRLALVAGTAAAIGLLITGTILVVGPRWKLARDRNMVASAPETPVEIYRAMARRDFRFDWACADQAEFAEYAKGQFGQAFVVATAPELEVLGWAYPSSVLGSPTGVLVGRESGQPAVLLVTRLDSERRQATGVFGDLTVTRREVGELVFYEVSPRTDARLLDQVVPAEE